MSKAKKIEIVMVKSGVRAVAELVEARAPKPVRCCGKALEKSLIAQGMHAAWTGRCVYIVIPEASRTFDPAAIPFENGNSG